jgi:hypothetical protein
MQKSSIIFGVAMFIVTAVVTYLNLSKHNVMGFDLVLSVLITSGLLSVSSTVAYFFGVA